MQQMFFLELLCSGQIKQDIKRTDNHHCCRNFSVCTHRNVMLVCNFGKFISFGLGTVSEVKGLSVGTILQHTKQTQLHFIF